MPKLQGSRIFAKTAIVQTKKFVVLTVLFLLPITVYLFFASAKNNFVKLPTLTYGVAELNDFEPLDSVGIQLEDRITVLTFYGSDIDSKKASAFNLAHKIYKKNHQFDEFQFVSLITPDQADKALALQEKIREIADPEHWYFAQADAATIEKVFNTLGSTGGLDSTSGSFQVFIIDKQRSLRGRNDDEDYGVMYGYNSADYAEINNKMSDDIKVVLAEYRLALKKYKAEREI